jgi:L-lactate utilization protein LutB
MIPIVLMEPDSTSKWRHFARTLLGPRSVLSHPTLEDLKDHVREVRSCTVRHLDSPVDELASRLTAILGVGFSFAVVATRAIGKIISLASGTPIAINKSAVVTEELVPGMVASNLRVIETYCVQVKPLDTDILSH